MQGLKRFDIAIIYVPEKKEYLVKRVIGLPGETIEYRQDQLLVNGEAVAEDFFDQDYKRSQSWESCRGSSHSVAKESRRGVCRRMALR